jgi:hypothetical protein
MEGEITFRATAARFSFMSASTSFDVVNGADRKIKERCDKAGITN